MIDSGPLDSEVRFSISLATLHISILWNISTDCTNRAMKK
jgi:hypothetical protein